MSLLTANHEDAMREPSVRTVTRTVPNLHNSVVAAEYRRQREIIYNAARRQYDEMQFWESVQSTEGWV